MAQPLESLNGPLCGEEVGPSQALRYRVFAMVGFGIAVQYWIRASISVAVTLAPERYGTLVFLCDGRRFQGDPPP